MFHRLPVDARGAGGPFRLFGGHHHLLRRQRLGHQPDPQRGVACDPHGTFPIPEPHESDFNPVVAGLQAGKDECALRVGNGPARRTAPGREKLYQRVVLRLPRSGIGDGTPQNGSRSGAGGDQQEQYGNEKPGHLYSNSGTKIFAPSSRRNRHI